MIKENIEGITNQQPLATIPDCSVDDMEDQQQDGESPTMLPHEEINSWKSRLRPRWADAIDRNNYENS